jgi:hypothetical protein
MGVCGSSGTAMSAATDALRLVVIGRALASNRLGGTGIPARRVEHDPVDPWVSPRQTR